MTAEHLIENKGLISLSEVNNNLKQEIAQIVDDVVAQNETAEIGEVRAIIASSINQRFSQDVQGFCLYSANRYLDNDFIITTEKGLHKGPYKRKNSPK